MLAYGAMAILFGGAALYALAVAGWLAWHREWKNAGIVLVFAVIFGLGAADYGGAALGKPFVQEDPSTPRLH